MNNKLLMLTLLTLSVPLTTKAITIQGDEVIYGFAVNKPNLDQHITNKTPIFIAALLSSPMAQKFKIDAKYTKGIPLDKQFDEFKRLVEVEKADINSKDWQGDTLLGYAVTYGIDPVFNYLIEKGADVNAGRVNPLITAAEKGRLEYVKKLLDKGANVTAKDKLGRTALDKASNEEIKTLLREKGAK